MSFLALLHDVLTVGDIAGAEAMVAGQPDPFEAELGRAAVLMRQRRFPEALAALDVAETIRRCHPATAFQRGVCLFEVGRFEDAIAAQRRCVTLAPSFAQGWMKLGANLLATHRWAEALACQERAHACDPKDPEVMVAYGTALYVLGDDAAAEAQYRAAWQARPDDTRAEIALSMALLRAGKWREGFERFEGRWRLHPFGAPWDFRPQPFWSGKPEDLRGKRVTLVAEQGFGDTIHFCRYVPLVVSLAADVTFAVQPTLERLMGHLGARVVRFDGPLPDADVTVPLMSLPHVFGTTVETAPPPCLPALVPQTVGARVGVCWHGGARPHDPSAFPDDQRRSIPLPMFQPIIDAAGGKAISLQQEDLAGWGVHDWMGTAAMIAGLDLVVTVDTAVAHLAASLGVETWMLARAGGCWRWLSSGDRTVWYPAMRIFRQPVLGAWEPVITDVARRLAERMKD